MVRFSSRNSAAVGVCGPEGLALVSVAGIVGWPIMAIMRNHSFHHEGLECIVRTIYNISVRNLFLALEILGLGSQPQLLLRVYAAFDAHEYNCARLLRGYPLWLLQVTLAHV